MEYGMTTTNFARLQDIVRMNAPGALDGIIRMACYYAMKEFFDSTDAWLLEVPIYIDPTTNDYQISTCQNVIVNRLMALERPRSPPPPTGPWPPDYLPMQPPQYLRVAQSEDQPYTEAQNPLFRTRRAGALLNAGSKCPFLRIAENPSTNEVWIATLSLNVCDPTDPDGFTTPPDWVMEKWLEYIASGVCRRLMVQPGKPYSSTQGAQYHGRMFNQGIGIARTEVRRMFSYGSQRWAFPGGWNAPRPRLPSTYVLP
jgi:hypothetical protein